MGVKIDESKCEVSTESEGTSGNKVRKTVKCCQRLRGKGRGLEHRRPARYWGCVNKDK